MSLMNESTSTGTGKEETKKMNTTTVPYSSVSRMPPLIAGQSPSSIDTYHASGVSILLSDYSKFGFAERICYHFDLIGTLTSTPLSKNNNNNNNNSHEKKNHPLPTIVATEEDEDDSNDDDSPTYTLSKTPVCGVSSLLECVPNSALNKLSKRHRRLLRSRLKEFNSKARLARFTSSSPPSSSSSSNDRIRCHQPKALPLKLTPTTRFAFAYEITNIVLCLDASPTLVATFGNMGSNWLNHHHHHENEPDDAICALDRLGPMVKNYLLALVDSIPGSISPSTIDAGLISSGKLPFSKRESMASMSTNLDSSSNTVLSSNDGDKNMKEGWSPELAVTVIALYPDDATTTLSPISTQKNGPPVDEEKKANEYYDDHSDNHSNAHEHDTYSNKISLLVRDFRVVGEESAIELATKIQQWAMTEVETTIAARWCGSIPSRSTTSSSSSTLVSHGQEMPNEWTSLSSSSLNDMIKASKNALTTTLPPEGRPCFVIATDCRSVSCDSILDSVTNQDLKDIPVNILDLSAAQSHRRTRPWDEERLSPQKTTIIKNLDNIVKKVPYNQPLFLSVDHDGPFSFPLNLSDDSEALYDICRYTGGCFFDQQLLNTAVKTIAGNVISDSPFYNDHYFSLRRRTLWPNAVQWYTIFSLSHLCPLTGGSWGKLPSPEYIRQKRHNLYPKAEVTIQKNKNITLDSTLHGTSGSLLQKGSRTTFSMYSLSPIRAKGILLMRFKDGFRAKRYGHNTKDSDKVSLALTLPLEYGTSLHYEFSYVANPYHNAMVGSAHVKIELSGDPSFIQTVKNAFIAHQINTNAIVYQSPFYTISQRVSTRICDFLKLIRKEDCLESFLCPLEWGDNLLSVDSIFLKRIQSLNTIQRNRHFQSEHFNIICTGGNRFVNQDTILSAFVEDDYGAGKIFETLSKWSTQCIIPDELYLKKIVFTDSDLTYYCTVEVSSSNVAARLFNVHIDFFGLLDPQLRLDIIEELKSRILMDEHLLVPSIMISEFMVNPFTQNSDSKTPPRSYSVNNFFHHETWELLNDPEVLPLISRRRSFFGNFILLEESNSHAIFAKFLLANDRNYLAQYFIKVFKNRVTVHMFMEKEHGRFCKPIFPSSASNKNTEFYPLFHTLLKKVKDRDLKCARALRSRRKLLSVFEDKVKRESIHSSDTDHTDDVKRLLAYSSREVKKLRFFKPGSGKANGILAELIISFILSDGFDMQVSRINVTSDKVEETDEGDWFLIRHDWHTISLVLFPILKEPNDQDSSNTSTVYHDFILYTSSIADLYYVKTDVIDDDSTAGNDTENQCVAEVFDALDNVYNRIYARAAYLALMKNGPTFEAFDEDDFNKVIHSCIESKIANVIISKENQTLAENISITAGTKLKAMLSQMVSAVPGGGIYTYFKSTEMSAILNKLCDQNDQQNSGSYDSVTTVSDPDSIDETVGLSDDQPRFISADTTEFSLTEGIATEQSDEQSNFDFSESSQCVVAEYDLQPPIFLKFTLNGKTASLEDFSAITSTSVLNVYITVFDDSKRLIDTKLHSLSRELPPTHSAIAHRLVTSLNSFVAEQTLERLRHIGPTISDIDLKTAKKRLLEANSVISKTIPLQFYVSKVNKMVSASEENVTEGILESAFELLRKELKEQDMMTMKQTKSRDFFVTDGAQAGSPLQYWCFIKIPKNSGPLTVYVYHPSGKEQSEEIMQKATSVSIDTNHRVNQILLLDRLHETRSASSLLIEEAVSTDSSSDQINETYNIDTMANSEIDFKPGHFKCPITFQSRYILNHRCSVAQAIMSLESSILQNFAVSNRPRFFVYKDEDENVFYITLKPYESPNTNEINSIQLLVHGITKPGPSITKQLDVHLQKKLVSKYLDIMSNLLTKNPRFNLLPEDMDFFRSFQKEWRHLENIQDSKPLTHEVIYAIPSFCYDPVMLLMYFRQNITGSTFFHTLHESNVDERNTNTAGASNDDDDNLEVTFKFTPQDFSLLYNTKPSQLDPDYQPVSTLTDAGKKFLQETGYGLAIIEINLLDKGLSPINYISIGGTPRSKTTIVASGVRFRKFENLSKEELDLVEVFLSVRIINTKLNTEVIHKWVELTLNQVLIGWYIEHHLQNSMMASVGSYAKNNGNRLLSATISRDHLKEDPVDDLCLGHSYLKSLLETADNLPHPGIKKNEFNGTLKSTMISRLTLNILEHCILNTIFNEKKVSIRDIPGLQIVRRSKKRKTQSLVQLLRNNASKEITTRILETGENFADCPTDSPEYICTYGLSPDTEAPRKEKRRNILAPPLTSLLFQQVATENLYDSSKKSLVDAVKMLKSKNPSVFYRHIAFIVTVSRTSCHVLTYNWNPQCHLSTIQKVKEAYDDAVLCTKKSIMNQQMKCLYNLDIPAYVEYSSREQYKSSEQRIEKKLPGNLRRNEEINHVQKKDNKLQSIEEKSGISSKRIPRPTKILRPTLVGKSVDGSASRAVAASRARASSRTIPGKKKSSNVSNTLSSSAKKGPPLPGKDIVGAQKRQTIGQDRSHNAQNKESVSGSKNSESREIGIQNESPIGLINLPNSHKKDLSSLLSQFPPNPRNLFSYGAKYLMCNWLSNIKGNEVDFLVLEHILSHGIILRISTIPVTKSIETYKNQLLLYLAKSFARDRSDLFCISKEKTRSSKKETSTAYVKVTFISQKSFRANLVYQISARTHPLTKQMYVKCICFLLTDMLGPGSIIDYNNDRNLNFVKQNKVVKRRLKSSENASFQLDSFSNSSLDNLNISGKIFNFVSSMIRSCVLYHHETSTVNCIPLVIREIFDVYPTNAQERLNGCYWRMLYRKIRNISDMSISAPSILISTFLLHLCNNSDLYGVKNCSANEVCILCRGDKLNGETFVFLMQNAIDEDCLDMFILCMTNGTNLNDFTFLNQSRYAIRIFEEIFLDANRIVKKLLHDVSNEVRRISLWEKISHQNENTEIQMRIEEILGLRILPFMVNLEDFDPHLLTLLRVAENDLELEWESLFYSMRQDESFTNAISFVEEQSGNVITLFCMTEDILLLFEIDLECKLKSADLIMKDSSIQTKEQEKVLHMVKITATFILNWIWTYL